LLNIQKGVQRLLLRMFSKSVRLTTIYSRVIDTVLVVRYTLAAVTVATKI